MAVEGESDAQSLPPGMAFHPASAVDQPAVAQGQADLRRRILRAFVDLGLIEKADAKKMLAYPYSGFRSMPVCASKQKIAPPWSGWCASL